MRRALGLAACLLGVAPALAQEPPGCRRVRRCCAGGSCLRVLDPEVVLETWAVDLLGR